MKNKFLILGDLHMKQKLGYADHIKDGRVQEEQDILDFIISEAKDCDKVVFLGDQLDARNNPSEVIKRFVNFVERLNDGSRKIFIILGNHELLGDGKSALDFYKEINDPNIKIISNEIYKWERFVFCPYFYKGQLGAKNYVEASKKIIEKIPSGDILFAHLTVSDLNIKGISSNTFNEIILPREKMASFFKKTITGHIHVPSNDEKVLVAGSIFNNEVGEQGKFIYKMDENLEIETIALPGRKILKLENPTDEQIKELDKNCIVKVILNKTKTKEHIEEMRKLLGKHSESFVIVEDFKNQRKKVAIEVGKMNFEVENLLSLYAEQKKVDLVKLKRGYELIKQ